MKRASLLFGAIGAVAMVGAATAQLVDLPAGPNRDVVSRKCQGCHDLSVVVEAAGLSRQDWNDTIEEMVTSNGMSVTPEERAKILDYLSSYLGPATPDSTAR
jgi:cytochrome c5